MKTSKRSSETFRFKQFTVCHSRSSMKVGVDGVLIGAWGSVEGLRGLDAGCGCGLIALMAAQRNPACTVEALDIDDSSITEAYGNFRGSPWGGRLLARNEDVMEFAGKEENQSRFDFIISNPPFFASGVKAPSTPRERARHEGSLSPSRLVEIAERLLAPGGTLSMILPADNITSVKDTADLKIERTCLVADREGKEPKRMMVEMRKRCEVIPREERLYIREGRDYSPAYRYLTKDFYLAF